MIWLVGIFIAMISIGIIIMIISLASSAFNSFYGDSVLACITLFIVMPIGFAIIFFMWTGWYESYFSEQITVTLNQKEWVCSASHSETSSSFVQSGKVMVPITTQHQVCDQYNRI